MAHGPLLFPHNLTLLHSLHMLSTVNHGHVRVANLGDKSSNLNKELSFWILVSCRLYRVTSALMRKPEGTGKKKSIPIRGVVYHLGFCCVSSVLSHKVESA